MKANDIFTHINNPTDVVYLRTKAFPVNIRLAKARKNDYYNIFLSTAYDAIREAALTKVEDYKLPHGMSGANLAIPLNIIAIVRNRGEEDANVKFFTNPVITETSGKKELCTTNCGSIRLPNPIKIWRYVHVKVMYFDNYYDVKHEWFHGGEAKTIQHEIDHNNGILITDHEWND